MKKSRNRKYKNVYALYKGEEILCIGTVKEIAQNLNIKERTVYFYLTPAYQKRCEKFKNYRILIKVEE